METVARRRDWPVWIGSALLTITALFHFTGFFAIPAPTPGSGSPSFFEAALRPLWLLASLHWLLTAVICVLVVNAPPRVARTILLACAAVVFADAVLLYRFIGPFIGEAFLTAAALLLAWGGLRARADDHTERT
jgi:hypothetical protein